MTINESRSLKILVLGKGRHGKDTFAERLASNLKLKFISSSEFANEKVVFPVLSKEYGYKTLAECFADRHKHRVEWRDLIREYNSPDKSTLAKEMLKEHDLYVGMRCHLEYEASKDLFDYIFWVDASDRVPQEDPSLTIEYDPRYMIWIDNNGCISAFKRQIHKYTVLLEGSAELVGSLS